jgi:hypothetical protein
MKTKIITATSNKELEEKVNAWLAENKDKLIKQISHSQSGITTASFRATAMILYEE